MRYDAGQRQRTRDRVLQEAARALRSDGPLKLGVAEVMSRAGLTHGGFYAHFASKDQLLAEAVDAAFGDARRMFDAATEGRSPREALAIYISSYLSMSHRDDREAGCPLPALAADLTRMEGRARELYGAGVHRLTGRLRKLMEAAGVPEPEITAPSVVAELVGAIALARATPDAAEAAGLLKASRTALTRRLGLESSQ